MNPMDYDHDMDAEYIRAPDEVQTMRLIDEPMSNTSMYAIESQINMYQSDFDMSYEDAVQLAESEYIANRIPIYLAQDFEYDVAHEISRSEFQGELNNIRDTNRTRQILSLQAEMERARHLEEEARVEREMKALEYKRTHSAKTTAVLQKMLRRATYTRNSNLINKLQRAIQDPSGNHIIALYSAQEHAELQELETTSRLTEQERDVAMEVYDIQYEEAADYSQDE